MTGCTTLDKGKRPSMIPFDSDSGFVVPGSSSILVFIAEIVVCVAELSDRAFMVAIRPLI